MTKILFILHLPPPVHGAAMMGKYIQESRLINQTFETTHINLTTARDINDIGKLGWRKVLDFFKLLFQIINTVIKQKPDICYVTPNSKGGPFYKDFIVVQLLKILHVQVIVHYHNKGVATRENKMPDHLLYKIFFKQLKVIVLADTLYADIKKYVQPENVYICSNGIPEMCNYSISKSTKLNSTLNILFLSNMMAEKGVWTLLEACKILKEKGQEFACHFVGKWSDIDEKVFNQKVLEFDLTSQVLAHGAKYEEEKVKYYGEADILVYPTYSDCFPLVLLEAMQHSLPIIASNEGAIAEIVEDEVTGYLVSKKNSEALANKLTVLLKDSSLRVKMGEAGRRKYENEYTLRKFEGRIVEILNHLAVSGKQ